MHIYHSQLGVFCARFPKLSPQDRRIIVLPQVIIESAMFFQEDAEETKQIKINLRDRATQNRVPGHPELVRQALMNIFDNCVKYSQEDSEVEVNQWIQKRSSAAIITIKSRPKHPIESDEMGKLFDLGFRGTNARKIIASGTGLGMYIAKKIVEDVHGGILRVKKSGGED